MNDTPILASARHQMARPGMSVGPAPMESDNVSRRRYSLAALRSIVAIWSERIRFRWKLEQLAKDSPHLIDDIGLTERQVDAELVKRFWQR